MAETEGALQEQALKRRKSERKRKESGILATSRNLRESSLQTPSVAGKERQEEKKD